MPARVQALLARAVASDPSGAEKVLIRRTGYFGQDGRSVQMFAIKRTREGYEKLTEQLAEEGGERPLYFVGHQANLRVLEQVAQRCQIAPERHSSNVEWFGNTGGASRPTVISQHWDKGPPAATRRGGRGRRPHLGALTVALRGASDRERRRASRS